MRSYVAAVVMSTALLSACGGGSGDVASSASSNANATVNLVVSDTPSTGITVLAFDVQIESAVLQPGNVALLPRPVTVDLAQLVSDSSLLASAVVGSATYTSMALTLANPQVTIMNNTGAALSLNGQTCAIDAVCTYTPVLNNATVTISNGVFPLTVNASSSTGLNLDLSIPDLLQSDLSVTAANGSSVNLSLFGNGSSQPVISDILGTVTAIDGAQVHVTTALGDALVLNETSSSSYSYPGAVCANANASCLAVGQVIGTGLTLASGGQLNISSLLYLGPQGSSWARAWVLGGASTSATPTVSMLVLTRVNSSSLSPGQVATVALPADASYGIATGSYPAVSGASFASPEDLIAGQEVLVSVGSDLQTGSTPTFSADTLQLVASQFVGLVGAVDASSQSLQLIGLPGLFTHRPPYVQSVQVQTGSSTDFLGWDDTALSSVSAGHFAAVKGPLFNTASIGSPTLAAVQVRSRVSGN